MKLKRLFTILETENLAETISFYTGFLGFERTAVFPEEDPVWASLRNGEFEISFSLPNPHMGYGKSILSGSIYLNVDDADVVWNQLRDKVEVVYPIETFDYGMREFGIRDNNGYVLNIGQTTED